MPSYTLPDRVVVLMITGRDEAGMLHRLASMANELRLNIEEAIGHTLADTVVLYAKLAGNEEDLLKVERTARAIFEKPLVVYSEIRNEPGLRSGMSPFPWKIVMHSPDAAGLLVDVTLHLAKYKLVIMSYHTEKYAPARSAGQFASIQTFIVRMPDGLNRNEFEDSLRAFARERRYFNAELVPL